MSRGPGALQREVLDVLCSERGLMTWDGLKDRFPLRLQDRSLHRAVRGLRKMGRIRVAQVNGRRWLAYCAPARISKADRDLLNLCDAAAYQLRMVAKARGVAVPEEATNLEESVDAYRRTLLPND